MERSDNFRISYFGEPSVGVWESPEYECCAFDIGGMVRLDIQRKDSKDGITWDELQRIKSACGFGDRDAVEFYPADRHVLNTGNWRHLYVFNDPLPIMIRKDHGATH